MSRKSALLSSVPTSASPLWSRPDHAEYRSAWLDALKADKRAIFSCALAQSCRLAHQTRVVRGPISPATIVRSIVAGTSQGLSISLAAAVINHAGVSASALQPATAPRPPDRAVAKPILLETRKVNLT